MMALLAVGMRRARLEAWQECYTMASRAADAGQSFLPQEQARWDYLNYLIDAFDAKLKAVHDAQATHRERTGGPGQDD